MHVAAALLFGFLWTALASGQTPQAAAPANEECVKCHGAIQAAVARKVKHAAVEGGCESCHVNHRQKNAAAKTAHYLSEQPPALCAGCHDVKDSKIASAHRGQPFETSACTGCHDPHGSEQPKLMGANPHGPFGARQCDSCHDKPKDGKVQLKGASASALCYGCHVDVKPRFEKAKFRHTLIATDENACKDCHDPHAGGRPHALHKPVTALCGECHADLTAAKKFVHDPARASCAICHDPHGANFEKSLKAQGNALCLECHDYRRTPSKNAAGESVLFGGTAVPEELVKQARKILVGSDGSGHPLMRHPTAGVADPSTGGKSKMSCLSCHDPHGGGFRQLYARDRRGQAMCDACHAK